MNLEPSRFPLRERRTRQCESFLDREDSQINRSKIQYTEPWIVNLLLKYKDSEVKKDGQFGHVLKVLNDASALKYGEQCPAAILTVADGCHYIQTIVTAQAAQMLTCDAPQSGFSGLVGQFIILTNYRVCFKEASEMEKCEFYIVIDCLHVLRMRRLAMKQQDCNREPSVLQKIKELWLKRFALQPSQSSEPASISDILMEIEEDRLNTLKQNVKDCLSVFSPNTELDSEQLAAYPDTKWQAELKQDKIHQNIFTVPAKLLVISPESNEAICKFCSPEVSQTVPHNGDSIEEEDGSTVSYFSAAESINSDDALENPWDIFPGMTLTTSNDNSGTPPSLPHMQQVLLANTPEEKASCSSSCTPDLFEPCAPMFHSNSEHIRPVVTVSSTMIPHHNVTSLKEPISQESRHVQMDIAHNNMSDTDESISCGQPPKNPCLQSAMLTLFPAHLLSEPLCENAEENYAVNLQKSQAMATSSGEEILETDRKSVVMKRKHMMANPSEIFLNSTCTRQNALEHPTARVPPLSNNLNKPRAQKPPLTFLSIPKRSRIEELYVQQHQVSINLRRSERLLEKREQGVAEGRTRSLERQLRVQQQDLKSIAGLGMLGFQQYVGLIIFIDVHSLSQEVTLAEWLLRCLEYFHPTDIYVPEIQSGSQIISFYSTVQNSCETS